MVIRRKFREMAALDENTKVSGRQTANSPATIGRLRREGIRRRRARVNERLNHRTKRGAGKMVARWGRVGVLCGSYMV